MGDGGIMERKESFKSAEDRARPIIPSASNGSWNWLSLIWITLMASLFLIVISGRNVLIKKTRDKVQPCLVPQTVWNQACALDRRNHSQERRWKRIFVSFWGRRFRSKFPPLLDQAVPHKNKETLGWLFLMVALWLKKVTHESQALHWKVSLWTSFPLFCYWVQAGSRLCRTGQWIRDEVFRQAIGLQTKVSK